jgi:hypothetical protein
LTGDEIVWRSYTRRRGEGGDIAGKKEEGRDWGEVKKREKRERMMRLLYTD